MLTIDTKKVFRIFIAVFLLSITLPFYSASASMNIKSNEDSNLIQICSANGIKWIALDDSGKEKDSNSKSSKTLHECPVCYLNKISVTTPSPAFNGIYPSNLASLVKNWWAVDLYSPLILAENLKSRAPPYIIA